MIRRLVFFFVILVPYMIVGVPIQFVMTRLNLPGWAALPRWFHKLACRFLGLRVTVIGQPERRRPTLIVSNHISWTDIIAIGSVADVTFVAKREVDTWPVVGFMASMQKTIYVDRTKKRDAKRTTSEMASRLADGGAVLLFAEGQSDTGTHVLPFRSALVGSAQAAMREAGAKDVVIQPMAIAYTRLQGLPLSRNERSQIFWVKSKSVRENIRDILNGGVKDVVVAFGTPMELDHGADRKAVTKIAENKVRHMLVALNRGLPLGEIAAHRTL